MDSQSQSHTGGSWSLSLRSIPVLFPLPSRTSPSPSGHIDTAPSSQSVPPHSGVISSESIVETENIPMSAIIESLESLQGPALAERVPYISQAVAVFLQVLTVLEAVVQRIEGLNDVNDTLKKVALLVGEVGRMCKDNNLGAIDLPPTMSRIFQSLKSELDPIEDALKRRNEMGGFKAMFLGAPLVWKVKKHARVILEELRALQAALAFDARFIQSAKRFKLEFTKVNARFDQGQTPLHVVSQLEQVDAIRSLIKRGAKLNVENADKETPLSLAAKNGNDEATKVLLGSKAKVDHQDGEGRTPLHGASENGHETVAQSLLESHANTDAKNVYEWTALHLASRTGKREVVQVLLRSGANVNMPNDSGWSALHMASRKGHRDVVELLLSNGGDVDTREASRGETALHLAAYYGNVAVAELLLSRGAKLNIRNKNNQTPLDLAMSEDHRDVALLLEGRS